MAFNPKKRSRRRRRSQYEEPELAPPHSAGAQSQWDEFELQLIRDLPSRAIDPFTLKRRKKSSRSEGHRPSQGDTLQMGASLGSERDPERDWAAQLRRRRTRRRTYLPSDPRSLDRANSLRGNAVRNILDERDHDGFGEERDAFLGQLEDEVTRGEALRELQAPLAAKRSIKAKLDTMDRSKPPDFFHKSRAQVVAGGRQMYKVLQFYAFGLWRSHLRTIASYFGSGVTSYFLFLRSLLLHNCIILVLALCFQVIPQLLYRFLQQSPTGYHPDVEFSPEQLLTGGGWFRDTVLYYGYYTNESIRIPSTSSVYYEMPYAYVLTAGAYLLLSVVIAVVSLSRSYRRHHVLERRTADLTIVFRVLNGWDYSMTRRAPAKLAHNAIYISFKEYLSKYAEDNSLVCGRRCFGIVMLRIFTNVVVLGVTAGACYLVYFIQTNRSLDDAVQESFLNAMLKPFVITSIVFIVPFIFTILGHFESYAEPRTELHMTMFRTMLLDGVVLGTMMWYWLTDLPKFNEAVDVPDQKKCWETSVGTQIYRLVLMDFVFLLIFSFLTEFIRKLVAQCFCKQLGRPEFNIGRNTLNLIYSQTLCWLGSFYSPLLSFIQIVKLIIFFYVKRVSVVMNCAPPTKAWRGSRVQTSFRFVLVLMCLFSTGAVAYGIITVSPSSVCGPYRDQNATADIIDVLRDDLQMRFSWLSSLVDFFKSPGFVLGAVIALIVVVHYTRVVAMGRKEQVDLLRSQVHLESLDKTYLLHQLRNAQSAAAEALPKGENGVLNAVSPPISAVQKGIIDTDSVHGLPGRGQSPHNKVFAKAALRAASEWMGSQGSLSGSPTKGASPQQGGGSPRKTQSQVLGANSSPSGHRSQHPSSPRSPPRDS